MSIHSVVGVSIALMLVAHGAAGVETRTYTGAGLLSDPAVSFPTTAPSLDGTSLVFGPGGEEFEKLLVLPLIPGGTYDPSNLPVTVSAFVKMTHLKCIDACAGTADFEAWIGFGDGTNIVGALTADDELGQGFAFECADGGTVGGNPRTDLLFDGAGYPDVGESFGLVVTLVLQAAGTSVALSYLRGSGSAISGVTLDLTRNINLVLLRDNDVGEQYQLNSVTISVEPHRFAIDIYDPDDRLR